MKTELVNVGRAALSGKGIGAKTALLSTAVLMGLTGLASAQSDSGNAGADAIIDGVEALAPIIALIIAACIGLGFLGIAAVAGWKMMKRFF